jgi:hypothetical protein
VSEGTCRRVQVKSIIAQEYYCPASYGKARALYFFAEQNFFKMIRRCLAKLQDTLTSAMYGSEPLTSKMHFYETADKDMDGNVVPMSKYIGDVVLVVNVASK